MLRYSASAPLAPSPPRRWGPLAPILVVLLLAAVGVLRAFILHPASAGRRATLLATLPPLPSVHAEWFQPPSAPLLPEATGDTAASLPLAAPPTLRGVPLTELAPHLPATPRLSLPDALAPVLAVFAAGLLAVLGARALRRKPRLPWAGAVPEGVVPPVPAPAPEYVWGVWPFSLPLQPYGRKVTLETEVVPGTIWTHDQVQGTVNVMVPVRQTVIRLRSGGLFVHNPVAPTAQLIRMMRRLEAQYGPVRHVVLGSLALEHKVTAAPFSRRFGQAEVWVMPGQYSYPLDLPNLFLGFRRTVKVLPADPRDTPFGDEIDYAIFGPARLSTIGAFGETAFYHQATRTLLVTDAVVRVDDEPPAILTEDPRALLFHARDDITEEVTNTAEVRRRGWRRIAQFGLNFLPSALDVVPAAEALRDVARRPPSMRRLGGVPFGLTPWRWARDDRPSFRALQGGLLVAPILRELIFNRYPVEALRWADRIAEWPFRRIIPCHLANDLRAGPRDFRDAFRFLEALPPPPLPRWVTRRPDPLPEDGRLLRDLNEALIRSKILAPPAPKV